MKIIREILIICLVAILIVLTACTVSIISDYMVKLFMVEQYED